jgi:lipid-binding SYLF domain-containing protein
MRVIARRVPAARSARCSGRRRVAAGQPAAEIDKKAAVALQYLGIHDAARTPLASAGDLVPNILKGVLFGGQFGDGALRAETGHWYRRIRVVRLQAGLQTFGYALFLMNDSALTYLDRSGGWEIGVGPTLVIVDKGTAGALTSTTARSDVYAFFFDQKGLMAGIGLQGTKVTRIHPE